MKIEAITLREIHMPLVHFFETSFGRTYGRRILLLTVHCEGVNGWGECVAGEDPFYSDEWIETAWSTIKQYLGPAILRRNLTSASDCTPVFAPVRGHRMAKAGIENALWDAEARQKNQPLWKLLGGTRHEVPCGVSIGIQDTVEQLLDKVETELAAGYRRIKVKVNDIYNHARLQREIKTSICLDESIRHARDAAAAVETGACRIVNIKVGRVGGFSEARKVHDVCQSHDVPVWCGGMLESGVGRTHNIALSTLENFRLPGDVSASKRYWQEDIIEPEVTVSPQGFIQVNEQPGTGYRVREELIDRLTVRKEMIRTGMAQA